MVSVAEIKTGDGTVVESFLAMSTPVEALFVIAVLSVLWKYGDLPKIDWKWFATGAMLFLLAASLEPFTAVAGAPTHEIRQVEAMITAIGTIFVVVGALLNFVSMFKK